MRTFIISIFLFVSISAFSKDALDIWYSRDARVVNRIRFVNGLFIGVGNNGTILTSTNGQTWTARNSGTTATLNDVCFGSVPVVPPGNSSRYIVVGANATILVSSNAIDWSLVTTTNTCDLYGVAFGLKFIAVGNRLTTSQPNALSSSDGITWTPLTFPNATPEPGFGFGYRTHSIIAVGGFFMAAGSQSIADTMWRSTGGSTWETTSVSGTIAVMDIAYGNGRAIAIGYEGSPLISTNVGPAQTWFSSSTNWCVRDGTCLEGNGIAFGNGTFLAAAPIGLGTFRTIDGISWTKHSALSGVQVSSLTFGNGTFVAAGANGIYQSEPVSTPGLSIAKESTDQLKITVTGEIGRGYRLQTSTNFSNWSDISTFTNTAPSVKLLIEHIEYNSATFYKAVTP